MEGSICKVKFILKKCLLAYVTVFLKQFIDRREATVSITSRHTTAVVSLTLHQLLFLHEKIQQSQFDGTIDINDWLSTASHEMRLFKYKCGALFLLEFRNCRVKIDSEVIRALIYAQQRIQSFIHC